MIVTGKVLQDLFSLTGARITQLASDGVVVKEKRNQYWLLASVRGYTEFLRKALSKKAGGQDVDEYRAQKARHMRLQADEQELKNRTACRDLVLVAEMEPRLREWASRGVQAVDVAAGRIEEMIESEFSIGLTYKHVREHLHIILRELESYPSDVRGDGGKGRR